jgi:hypothetical protein
MILVSSDTNDFQSKQRVQNLKIKQKLHTRRGGIFRKIYSSTKYVTQAIYLLLHQMADSYIVDQVITIPKNILHFI